MRKIDEIISEYFGYSLKKEQREIIEKDYLNDLNKIKETIRTNQAKAMVVISDMIMTYYEISTIFNQRKIRGNKYIERL